MIFSFAIEKLINFFSQLQTYKMRSKPRGHALIININKTLNQTDRIGSEVDERKLNKLFKDLGYKVVSRSNLNLKVSI